MAHVNKLEIENIMHNDNEYKFLNMLENFLKVYLFNEIDIVTFINDPQFEGYIGGSFANNYLFSDKLNEFDEIHNNFMSDKAITNYNLFTNRDFHITNPEEQILKSLYFNMRLNSLKELIGSYDLDLYLKLSSGIAGYSELEKEFIVQQKISKIYNSLNDLIQKYISGNDISSFSFNEFTSKYSKTYNIDSLLDNLVLVSNLNKKYKFALNFEINNKKDTLQDVKFELSENFLILISPNKMSDDILINNHVLFKNVNNGSKYIYNFNYIYCKYITVTTDSGTYKYYFNYDQKFKEFLRLLISNNYIYTLDYHLVSNIRSYVSLNESIIYENINGNITNKELNKLFTFYLSITQIPLDIYNNILTENFINFKVNFMDINIIDKDDNIDLIPLNNLKEMYKITDRKFININLKTPTTVISVNINNLLNLIENKFKLFKKFYYVKKEKSVLRFFLIKSLIDNNILSELVKENLSENKNYILNLFRQIKEYFKLLDFVKDLEIKDDNSHIVKLINFINENNLEEIYKIEDFNSEEIIDVYDNIMSIPENTRGGIFKNTNITKNIAPQGKYMGKLGMSSTTITYPNMLSYLKKIMPNDFEFKEPITINSILILLSTKTKEFADNSLKHLIDYQDNYFDKSNTRSIKNGNIIFLINALTMTVKTASIKILTKHHIYTTLMNKYNIDFNYILLKNKLLLDVILKYMVNIGKFPSITEIKLSKSNNKKAIKKEIISYFDKFNVNLLNKISIMNLDNNNYFNIYEELYNISSNKLISFSDLYQKLYTLQNIFIDVNNNENFSDDKLQIYILIFKIIKENISNYNLNYNNLFKNLVEPEYEIIDIADDIDKFNFNDFSINEVETYEKKINKYFLKDTYKNKVKLYLKMIRLFYSRISWKLKILIDLDYKFKNIIDSYYSHNKINNYWMEILYINHDFKKNEFISKLITFDDNFDTPYKLVKRNIKKFKNEMNILLDYKLDPEFIYFNPNKLRKEDNILNIDSDIKYVKKFKVLDSIIHSNGYAYLDYDEYNDLKNNTIILFYGIIKKLKLLNNNKNKKLFPNYSNLILKLLKLIDDYYNEIMILFQNINTEKLKSTNLKMKSFIKIITLIIRKIIFNESVNKIYKLSDNKSINSFNFIFNLYNILNKNEINEYLIFDNTNLNYSALKKPVRVIKKIKAQFNKDLNNITSKFYNNRLFNKYNILLNKYEEEIVNKLNILSSKPFTDLIAENLNVVTEIDNINYLFMSFNDVGSWYFNDEIYNYIKMTKSVVDLFMNKYFTAFNLINNIYMLVLRDISDEVKVKLYKILERILIIVNLNIDKLEINSDEFIDIKNKIDKIILDNNIEYMTGGVIDTNENLLNLLCMINYDTVKYRNLRSNIGKSIETNINEILLNMKNVVEMINTYNIRIQNGYILYGIPIKNLEANFKYTYDTLIDNDININPIIMNPKVNLISFARDFAIKYFNKFNKVLEVDSTNLLRKNKEFFESRILIHNNYLVDLGDQIRNIFVGYTGNMFKEYNRYLQNKLTSNITTTTSLLIESNVDTMIDVLNNIDNYAFGEDYFPVFSSKYYNMLNNQRNFDYKGAKIGDLYYFPHFMSTTYELSDRLINKFIPNYGDFYVIFIKKNAKYILAEGFTMYSNEFEIILPPGKLFFIESKDVIYRNNLQKVTVFVYENIEKMNDVNELANYFKYSMNSLIIRPWDESEIKIKELPVEEDNFIKQYDFNDLRDNPELKKLDELIRYNVSPLFNIGSIKAVRMPEVEGSVEGYGLVLDRNIMLHTGTRPANKYNARLFLSEISTAWSYAYTRYANNPTENRKLFTYYYTLTPDKPMILIDYFDERNLGKIYEYWRTTTDMNEKRHLNTYFNFKEIETRYIRPFIITEFGERQEFYYNGEYVNFKYYNSLFGNIKQTNPTVQKYSKDTNDDLFTFDIIRDKIFKNPKINGYISRASLTMMHANCSFNDEIMLYNNFEPTEKEKTIENVRLSEFYFNPTILIDTDIFLPITQDLYTIINNQNILDKYNFNAMLIYSYKFAKKKNNRMFDILYNNNLFGRVLDKEDYWYHKIYVNLHNYVMSILTNTDVVERDILAISQYPTENILPVDSVSNKYKSKYIKYKNKYVNLKNRN